MILQDHTKTCFELLFPFFPQRKFHQTSSEVLT